MSGEVAVDGASGESVWDQLIDQHLVRQTVERGLSRNSLEAYSRDLDDFHQFCRAHHITPEQLDTRIITVYLEDLAEREFASSRQRRRLAAARGLFRSLLDRGILPHDPARNLKLRPQPRPLPRTLGPKEIELLIASIDAGTARGLRDRAMLEM